MVTSGGAETLPFLASCVVLPASLVFFVLYGRILDLHLPRSSVFALTVRTFPGIVGIAKPAVCLTCAHFRQCAYQMHYHARKNESGLLLDYGACDLVTNQLYRTKVAGRMHALIFLQYASFCGLKDVVACKSHV